MSLVVLLQIIAGEEELGTMPALNHVLFFIRRQPEQVLVGAQSFLLDLEFLLHCLHLFLLVS